jgi:trk system potassium uptake protein
MKKREYVIFGLGRFGTSVAETLANDGNNVMVVDHSEEKIQEISDLVTYAVRADVKDSEVVKSLGISNMDVAIVAITGDTEANIMATIIAKEAGVPIVIAKANSEMQGKLLKKVGADQVIFPEKAMGVRLARSLGVGNFVDIIELSSTISLIEVEVPKDWIGKSLCELNPRKRLGINVIAKQVGNQVEVNLEPDKLFVQGEILIIVGDNEKLGKLGK